MDDPFILTRDAIKVLAVDTRLDILKLLDERPHTLTEIKDSLDLAAATVSEHLAKLEEAGLIVKQDEGRKWKYYVLTAQGEKLFAKKPAGGLMFAFVLSTIAAGTLTILSFMNASTQAAQPMAARMESDTAMLAAEVQSAASASPDWLLIGAIVSSVLAIILLIVILAKRLKTNR